MLQLVHVDL